MSTLLGALMGGAVGLPMVTGSALLGAAALRRGISARYLAAVGIVVSGLAGVCALGLSLLGQGEVLLPAWLPGTGAISLYAGGTGGYAALVTTVGLLVVVAISAPRGAAPLALLLVASGSANAAFLSGNFLARYVALEVVALCIALSSLAERGPREGASQATFVTLLLRLGDLGLLVAILILVHAGGSLDIAVALDAGERLQGARLSWTVIGLALAVWVKTGTWPFAAWQLSGRDLPPASAAWLYGLVMPNLGIYLLYRVAPLLLAVSWLRWAVLGCAAASGVVAAARWVLARDPAMVPGHVSALLGSAALAVAAGGAGLPMTALLFVGTPLRLTLSLVMRSGIVHSPVGTSGPSDRLQAVFLRLAARSRRAFEVDVLEQGVALLWRGMFRLAASFRREIEIGVLEHGVALLWRGMLASAAFLHRGVEQDGLGAVLQVTARGAVSGSRRLQRYHTGRLRTNLRWVAVALVVTTAVMAVWTW
jgi:formate hydrogenlyase subunit 3/multisubunit Na+/H+ antiporter MnhD subunit